MKMFVRLMVGLFALLAIATAALYLFRAPLAGAAIRAALTGAGVENPSFTVESVSADRIELSAIRAGSGDEATSIEKAVVFYDLGELWRQRRLERLVLGPGQITIDIGDNRSLSIAGVPIAGGGGDGAKSAPVEGLTLDRLTIAAAMPEGLARVLLNGDFHVDAGGAFQMEMTTDATGFSDFLVENGNGDGVITLAPDGAIAASGSFTGDLTTATAAVRDASFIFAGEAKSWRDALAGDTASLTGRFELDLRSADFPARDSKFLTSLSGAGQTLSASGPISVFSLAGNLIADFSPGRLSVIAGDAVGARLVTNRGDRLRLTAIDGQPLYELNGRARRAGFVVDLDSPAAVGEARLSVRSPDNENWTYEFSASLAEQSMSDVSLGATALQSTGTVSGPVFSGDLQIASLVENAEIGRLRIIDAPFVAEVMLSGDLHRKTVTIASGDDNCVRLDRATFTLRENDAEAQLTDARFCGGEGPLAIVRWDGAPGATLAGALTAAHGRYEIGDTIFNGAPPRIDFTARYDPAAHLTNVDGILSGGSVVLNDGLRGANAQGDFTATYSDNGFSARATLSRMTVSQTAETPTIAPVSVSGDAALEDNKITFDFAVSTPDRMPIGDGEGVHDVKSGYGTAKFTSRERTFHFGALQPAKLVPPLLGIVGETTGAMSVDMDFAWRPGDDGVASSAAFVFDNITFRGPGRAVSQTIGLSGALDLVDLTPLKSDGEQFLTVKRINLDALILEDGEIAFKLPGDETVQVIKAEFPWFGGTIGAYDTVSSIAGDKATAELRAANVDLSKMLAYLKIDGLSGQGVVEGVLPLVVDGGRVRIENGEMSAIGPGVIRYQGEATNAAGETNEQVKLAFDVLRDLRFEKLTAQINGPLDGSIQFKILFEGMNNISLDSQGLREPVTAPIIYRINIDAPLLALIDQARLSSDFKVQLDRLRGATPAETEDDLPE